MKKILGFTIVSFWVTFCFFSISQANDLSTKPQGKEVYWSMPTHGTGDSSDGITGICAKAMGLSNERANIIDAASAEPDVYESGIEHAYNQQWSHAFLLDARGKWVWGDADDNFHDNLEGGKESHGKSARENYEVGNIKEGDKSVGHAIHYIQDVSLVLHSTFPTSNMLQHHFNFEKWIDNNLNKGHKFLDKIKKDRVVYAVKDLKDAIREAAWKSSYNGEGIGKRIWDLYTSEKYPTETGSGSPELVKETTEMLLNAARYTKGTIEYVLSKYKMAR